MCAVFQHWQFISFNPNQISYIRLFVAFLSLIILSYGYYAQGVLLFFISYIIDCIDGNIARIKNRASYYGKYFDGFGEDNLGLIDHNPYQISSEREDYALINDLPVYRYLFIRNQNPLKGIPAWIIN